MEAYHSVAYFQGKKCRGMTNTKFTTQKAVITVQYCKFQLHESIHTLLIKDRIN